MRMGFRTTSRTKPIIVGKLRTALASDVIIHSPILKGELDTFIEHEDGTLGAQDGAKDDRVMAAAMAVYGMESAAIFSGDGRAPVMEMAVGAEPDPFVLDNILKALAKRGSGDLPISSGIRQESN